MARMLTRVPLDSALRPSTTPNSPPRYLESTVYSKDRAVIQCIEGCDVTWSEWLWEVNPCNRWYKPYCARAGLAPAACPVATRCTLGALTRAHTPPDHARSQITSGWRAPSSGPTRGRASPASPRSCRSSTTTTATRARSSGEEARCAWCAGDAARADGCCAFPPARRELNDLIPFGNNPLYRYFFGWLGAPKVAFLKLFMTRAIRESVVTKHVVQDIIVPIDAMRDGLELFHKQFDLYPLLVFPIRVYDHGDAQQGFLRAPRKVDGVDGPDGQHPGKAWGM